MEKLTEHFTFEELTTTSNTSLLQSNREDAKAFMKHLKYTAATLEEIRAVLQVKMKITSGFRNEVVNNYAKGSPTSGHTKGLCADFIPLDMDVDDAFNMLLNNKDKLPSLYKCISENIGGRQWLHIQTKTEASQPTKFFTTTNGKQYMEVL